MLVASLRHRDHRCHASACSEYAFADAPGAVQAPSPSDFAVPCSKYIESSSPCAFTMWPVTILRCLCQPCSQPSPGEQSHIVESYLVWIAYTSFNRQTAHIHCNNRSASERLLLRNVRKVGQGSHIGEDEVASRPGLCGQLAASKDASHQVECVTQKPLSQKPA